MYKVYKIVNALNEKKYVGMTSISLKQRLYNHYSKTYLSESKMTPFQKEMKKLGRKNFRIELIAQTKDKLEAQELERYYIQKLATIENGYNTYRGGKGLQLLTDDYADFMIETFHSTKSIRETAKILGKAEGTISRQLTYLGIDKGMYSRSQDKKESEVNLSYLESKHKKYAHNRKLTILEFDKSFNSIKECCEFLVENEMATSVNNCKPKITNCLNGYKKTYCGLHFVDKE